MYGLRDVGMMYVVMHGYEIPPSIYLFGSCISR